MGISKTIKWLFLFSLPLFIGSQSAAIDTESPFVVVLGVAQDAGYPQADCQKSCCRPAWEQPVLRRKVSSIAIVDPASEQFWVVDATPDFPEQQHLAQHLLPGRTLKMSGVFLTHAHIGHYTGLMYLGREVMGTSNLTVYAMPRMADFLVKNGPWSQLVSLRNIELRNLQADAAVELAGGKVKVTPMLVPHRDEFSETVGFKIEGPKGAILFIPDIDKWERWDRDINLLVEEVDIALLDGTFYKNGEISGRDMSQIPHPFIEESLVRFAKLPAMERAKIRFIHFNHTNPVLQRNSEAAQSVLGQGFGLGEEGERFGL